MKAGVNLIVMKCIKFVKSWIQQDFMIQPQGGLVKKIAMLSVAIFIFDKILSTNLERPLLLSECGGYTRPINNHLNSNKKQYGYGKTNSEKELTDKIEKMYQEMVIPSINNGLCGCIYTQISDIENEINGLYTYDRKICKVNQQRMSELARKLYSYYEKKSGLS